MDSKKKPILEFANPIRIDILQKLSIFPSSFTSLTKQLAISNSEVSRHINRLIEQKLVEKESGSKNLKLTSFGELLIGVYSPLDFIFYYADYFKEHDLIDLPISFLRNLDYLMNSELIQGSGNVMLKLQEITEGLKSEVWIMTDQAFPVGKLSMDTRYLVPPEMAKFRPNIENFNRSTLARVLPHISTALLVADGETGMIFFSDTKGTPDFTKGFYVQKGDEEGIKYLLRIWEYYWERGEIPMEK